MDKDKIDYINSVVKRVFNQLGYDSMLTKKIIFALSDYHVFDDCPPLRFILEDIISDGISQTFYSYLSSTGFKDVDQSILNLKISDAVQQIERKRGYSHSLVELALSTLLSPFIGSSASKSKTTNSTTLSSNTIKPGLIKTVNAQPVRIKAENNLTEIWLGSEFLGTGSWNGVLPDGEYEFVCKRTGYIDLQVHKKITNKTRRITLGALSPITGCIEVDVKPYGSKIYVDGQMVGKTPLIVENIPIGMANVKIKTPEGTSFSEIVDVSELSISKISHCIESSFLYDYSELQIGDTVYEDGSFSHKRLQSKKRCGVVFSLSPTYFDKQQGWIHGKICTTVKTSTFLGTSKKQVHWGNLSNSTSTFVKEKEILYFLKQGGESVSGFPISNDPLFVRNAKNMIFGCIADCKTPVPPKSSGWYIPSIYEAMELSKNLCSLSDSSIDHFLYGGIIAEISKFKDGTSEFRNQKFWSCSEKSVGRVWSWTLNDYYKKMQVFSSPKNEQNGLLIIAAF